MREAWETREVDGPDDPGWTAGPQEVLDEAARSLRSHGPAAARFDKLVLYEPEGHSVAHSDTLRSPDHATTLVVHLNLPRAAASDPAAGPAGPPRPPTARSA